MNTLAGWHRHVPDWSKPILRRMLAAYRRESGSRDAFHDQKMLLSNTPVQTIFDIGAHVGEITASYSNLFPKSTIYSFEPFPESFQRLSKRFKGNSLVKPVQLAVSSKADERKFYVNRDSGTNSLLPTVDDVGCWVDPNVEELIENITTIEVPVTTIDDFCKQKSIDEIQILKMDIEGVELMALEGASEKLSQGSISLIYTEILFVPVHEGQALFHEIYNFLSGYGYRLFNMYNFSYARSGQLEWGDAIFVK